MHFRIVKMEYYANIFSKSKKLILLIVVRKMYSTYGFKIWDLKKIMLRLKKMKL